MLVRDLTDRNHPFLSIDDLATRTRAVSLGFEARKGRFRVPLKISATMKTSVETLEPQATIKKAAELMLRWDIGRVPTVNEEDNLVGMVDREDIARIFL